MDNAVMRINGYVLLFKCCKIKSSSTAQCLAVAVSQPVCSYCLEVNMFFCSVRMNFDEPLCYLVLYLKYLLLLFLFNPRHNKTCKLAQASVYAGLGA